MLRSLDAVLGAAIIATDGEIGSADNVCFDDRSWVVHYLVVETGSWFTRRKVLISPRALGTPDWSGKKIPVLLTREQIRHRPGLSAEQPVCWPQSLGMVRYYSWADFLKLASEDAGDLFLRSAKEIAGYQAEASDGLLGTITDFIIDDERWGIVDLVVHPIFPPADRKVLIPTRWVSAVSWDRQRVQLNQPLEKSIPADFLTEA